MFTVDNIENLHQIVQNYSYNTDKTVTKHNQ